MAVLVQLQKLGQPPVHAMEGDRLDKFAQVGEALGENAENEIAHACIVGGGSPSQEESSQAAKLLHGGSPSHHGAFRLSKT